MYEEQDYILRLIHQVIRTLIKLVFKKDIDFNEEAQIPAEILVPVKKLRFMIEDGQINEAENWLSENLDSNNQQHFLMALLFYEKLNEQEDKFLEEHGFSRQEVSDGLKSVVSMYGYGNMMEAFLE